MNYYRSIQIRRLGLLTLLYLSSWGLSAQVQVSGTVNNESGEPLVGATVLATQTRTGANTDEAGTFTLRLPNLSDTLVVSYIGYETQKVPIQSRSNLTIFLNEKEMSADEIVIIGYGTQRKSDLTGSVSSVKGEELQRIPTASVAQSLQGRAAGVQVTPSSGEPGAGAVIRIRGVGTLNNASPLFVVDGMLTGDINFLNLNDVESVEVLKDASATAIYGSRGANGVIIITTKRGTAGPTQFNVSAYYGTQEVTQYIDLTNAQEYAILSNELAANDGRPEVFASPDTFGVGTNWQDVIFRQAVIQNYNISASGGTKQNRFNISADFLSQEGIVEGSQFDRVTFRLNNNYGLTDAVRVGHNLAFIYEDRQFAPNVIGNAYRADPTVVAGDTAGEFGNTAIRSSTGNPAAQIFYNSNNRQNVRSVGNVFLEADFLSGFSYKSNFGIDAGAFQGKNFVPVFFVSSIQQNDTNNVSVNTGYEFNLLWENTLSYSGEWNGHRLNALAGITAQRYRNENLGGSRRNVAEEDPTFYYLSAGQLNGQTNYNSAFEWAMVSYLGRVNYSYQNRYLLTATFRADGSSRFGENFRYGYFPSFAAGWNISEEAFMLGVSAVSRLKLRSSWGQIGNDKINTNAAIPLVDRGLGAVFGPGEQLMIGGTAVNLANPDLRWEETEQFDVGLELGLLQDRFLAEIDYYRRVTYDILVGVPIPDYVGSRNDPIINAASVLNRGIDLNLTWRETRGKLSYSLNIVASTVHNEVLSLGDGREEILGGGLGFGGELGTRTTVGSPIGAFYGYQVDGIFQNDQELEDFPRLGNEGVGDLRFADTNGDGELTPDDRVSLGSPIPNLIYGFNFSVEYAGFDLAAFFNGQRGNKIINSKRMARFGTPNFEAVFLDRWNGEGTSTTEPRITNGGHNYLPSDRFLQDGSFMRLRNVQLGYTLPQIVTQKIGIGSMRLYLSGTNLITWTEYTGYTPEITSGSVIAVGIDSGQYPIAKVYNAGVQVNF